MRTVQNRQSAGPGRARRGSLRQPGQKQREGEKKAGLWAGARSKWAVGRGRGTGRRRPRPPGPSKRVGLGKSGEAGERGWSGRRHPRQRGDHARRGGRDGGGKGKWGEATKSAGARGSAGGRTASVRDGGVRDRPGPTRQEWGGWAGRRHQRQRTGRAEGMGHPRCRESKRWGAGRDDGIHASVRAGQRGWAILDASNVPSARLVRETQQACLTREPLDTPRRVT